MSSQRTHPRQMPRWWGAQRAASERIVERFYGGSRGAPHVVYHYTDAAALISIVRSGEVWLSDATYLNDRSEIEAGLTLVRETLVRMASDPANADMADFIGSVSSLFDAKKRPGVYVCSLSEVRDDLTQWRGYGAGGSGVAIGLRPNILMFGHSSEVLLNRVIYDQADQVWIIETLVSEHLSALRQDLGHPIEGATVDAEKDRRICADRLYHALWQQIVFFKDASFASEREVRYTYLAHDFSDMEWAPEHATPLFRERRGIIIPYLTSRMLDFGGSRSDREHPPLPITEVMVGPRDDKDLLARGVRRLLDAHGHEQAAVTLSQVPFRG